MPSPALFIALGFLAVACVVAALVMWSRHSIVPSSNANHALHTLVYGIVFLVGAALVVLITCLVLFPWRVGFV